MKKNLLANRLTDADLDARPRRPYRPLDPQESPWPKVDDHLVDVESETPYEIIGGVSYLCSPAHLPHAELHVRMAQVLQAHLEANYIAAADLLTRFEQRSDFASDIAIVKRGIDPSTGSRYLEELAFEIVSEQSASVARKKAPRMLQRGVRRVFAFFVKAEQLCEWSVKENDWRPLDPDGALDDPCLHSPVAIRALLYAHRAEDALADALNAKRNPRLMEIKRQERAESRAEGLAEGRAEGLVEGRAKGKAEGLTTAVLLLLEQRGLAVSAAQRNRLQSCTDLQQAERWLERAFDVTSANELLAD